MCESLAPDILAYLKNAKENYASHPLDRRHRFDYIFALFVLGFEDRATVLAKEWAMCEPNSFDATFLNALFLRYVSESPSCWISAYEAGFDCGRRTPNRKFDVPRWLGEDLENKHILIWGEGGVGDIIRELRWLPHITAKNTSVTLEVPEKLVGLLGLNFPSIKVRREQLGDGDYKEHIDYECPTGSLSARCYQGDKSTAYLHVPSMLPLSVMARLREEKRKGNLLIGLCWRSMKMTISRNINYARLSDLLPILRVPGISFFSLQYDDAEEELNELLKDFGISIDALPEIDHFNDLKTVASLMDELDLVISASTSIADLAAAVGVETWRFQLGKNTRPLTIHGEYNPWYGNCTKIYYRLPYMRFSDVFRYVEQGLIEYKANRTGVPGDSFCLWQATSFDSSSG